MKQKDIAVIIAVAFLAVVIGLLLSQAVFLKDQRPMTAEVVEPINAEFKEPDPTVFNEQAVNPTQLIQIGENNNPTPF